MSKVVSLQGWNLAKDVSAKGLAPILCYDPYYRRMVQFLRNILADGHPALVRLHSAAEYPATDDKLNKIDMEGHAVMLVGYDDDKAAFAVADPWDKSWGGRNSGIRWIGYNELSMIIVDSTKDISCILAPLQVTIKDISTEKGRSLEIEVGYYAPQAMVVDRDNQDITSVTVEARVGDDVTIAQVSGRWFVGEQAKLIVPVPRSATDTVTIKVSAQLGGQRPYKYTDTIELECEKSLNAQEQKIVAVS